MLSRQNPVTGLLPASTAVTTHGDYTDAWVRDNVYSILAVWGLGAAYRRSGADDGVAHELQQSVVKLMRGLMMAMMRQSHKVERFKVTQAPLDSLHAKYGTDTGRPVVGDDEWGHLQVDATSIFLLMLAQMTASGLRIVFTLDEVNFVQNLVYYIGRAYRTADYGIWERGNKLNHGKPELNASSIGMAKAALEALNGLNLFGVDGARGSVIHVLEDEIARARITLESLLPRESASKETDAALLSVIGFPAFAVEDQPLRDRTRQTVIDKLQGNYGCKRFLRDGHQIVLEDTNRLHYEPYELKTFEHIECEWPLFFTYLLLDSLFRGDRQGAEEYQNKLQEIAVERDGVKLLPEVYFVPEHLIDAERHDPQSQERWPNENLPLVWAQSLWTVGQLILEGLLEPSDLDPLGRRRTLRSLREPVVQLALIAEDTTLQEQLATYGIETQTLDEIAPIQLHRSEDLSTAFAALGANGKLGLSGRPVRRLRALMTSQVYQIGRQTIAFLPSMWDSDDFYLTLDPDFLAAQLRAEVAYVARHWKQSGRPTVTLLLTHDRLDNGAGAVDPQSPLIRFIVECQSGTCDGIQIYVDALEQLLVTAGLRRLDVLDDININMTQQAITSALPDTNLLRFDPAQTRSLDNRQELEIESEGASWGLLERLRHSVNLYEQVEIVGNLMRLESLDFETGLGQGRSATVRELLEELYARAARGIPVAVAEGAPPERQVYWAIVRRTAGLLGRANNGLSDAVTDLLVRQKVIAVGRAYSEDAIIDRPMTKREVAEQIDRFCGEDIRDRVLSQEILIGLGVLIRTDPKLFKGFLTLRTSYFILLLVSELGRDLLVTPDEAYEQLMEQNPFEIAIRLRQVLQGYQGATQALQSQESLHIKQTERPIEWILLPDRDEALPPAGSWVRQREIDGSVNRVPPKFYNQVWQLLQHCKGIVIGDKLERRNRLDSARLLAEMTPGETNFARQVEHLLNKIDAPTYRQVCMETLMELSAVTERNPDLWVDDYLVLDVLVGYAVRVAWLDNHPQDGDRYNEVKSQAWKTFYETSPYACAGYVVKAFKLLLEMGQPEKEPATEVA
ncbi:MAG: glycoside hydrolase family 15 protein [Cyanobacteria bacterium P01_F01_bin.153]